MLLRIEDHDRERSRPEYERGILDDLAWLGFGRRTTRARRAHVCPPERSRGVVHARRSHRSRRAAWCTRAPAPASRSSRLATDGARELRYSGTCRDRGLRAQAWCGPAAAARGWRTSGSTMRCWARRRRTRQRREETCSIRDRLGQWTYQFAVTVDDTEQHIDLVIRGADLLASTGRQIRLARLLGRTRCRRCSCTTRCSTRHRREVEQVEPRHRHPRAACAGAVAGRRDRPGRGRAGLIERPRSGCRPVRTLSGSSDGAPSRQEERVNRREFLKIASAAGERSCRMQLDARRRITDGSAGRRHAERLRPLMTSRRAGRRRHRATARSIWSRADRPARMVVEYGTNEAFRGATTIEGPAALEDTDFTARIDLGGLPPGEMVFYRVRFDSLAASGARSEPVTGQFPHGTAGAPAHQARLVRRHRGTGLGHQPRARRHAHLRDDARARARLLRPLAAT